MCLGLGLNSASHSGYWVRAKRNENLHPSLRRQAYVHLVLLFQLDQANLIDLGHPDHAGFLCGVSNTFATIPGKHFCSCQSKPFHGTPPRIKSQKTDGALCAPNVRQGSSATWSQDGFLMHRGPGAWCLLRYVQWNRPEFMMYLFLVFFFYSHELPLGTQAMGNFVFGLIFYTVSKNPLL